MDINPIIPRIGRVENRDEICTVEIRFSPGSETGTVVRLKAGEHADLKEPIPFGAPEEQMQIAVNVLLGTRIDPRIVTIWYEEVDAMYQFIYTVSPEAGKPGPPTPLYAVSPTTPGNDIVLGIDYFGDGVVIVGTGDL